MGADWHRRPHPTRLVYLPTGCPNCTGPQTGAQAQAWICSVTRHSIAITLECAFSRGYTKSPVMEAPLARHPREHLDLPTSHKQPQRRAQALHQSSSCKTVGSCFAVSDRPRAFRPARVPEHIHRGQAHCAERAQAADREAGLGTYGSGLTWFQFRNLQGSETEIPPTCKYGRGPSLAPVIGYLVSHRGRIGVESDAIGNELTDREWPRESICVFPVQDRYFR